MSEKDLLEKWKQLKKMIEDYEFKLDEEHGKETSTNKTQNLGGKVKTLGIDSEVKNLYLYKEENENHKGYASALLLGFLTLVFQLLFIAIAYIIVK